MEKVQTMLRGLNSPDWWARSAAIKNLLLRNERDYLPALEKALRDHENALLRNASMELYVALGARALPSLGGLLKDNDPEVRVFAANLLGDIKDRRAVQDLIRAMKDTDSNVRVASTEALGKIGDSEAVEALSRALDDEPWVVMSAIKSLGDIGGEEALQALYECLERDEYRGITFDAIEAAGGEEAIEHITPFVERDDTREWALKAVVNIAVRIGIRIMPEYFASLVSHLLALLHSPHPEIRKAAFIALAWSEDVRGIPFFLNALNDDELQEYAISAILAIGQEAVPEIIDALRDTERRQRCVLADLLLMMGEHTALMQFSEDQDPEVRVEVAFAAGRIHSARTGEILMKMLDDPEDEVRLAAQKASRDLKRVR
jgi:HEAT repeat protein